MNFTPEIERIKNEYARRAQKIPKNYYSADNAANRFMCSTRKTAVEKIIKQNLLSWAGARILDVGCGRGDWLADFIGWGAAENNLHGVEILEDRFKEAVERFPRADLKLGNGSELPWANETFDLVLQATVFSSILASDLRVRLASEMFRVLKPGGFILWYDFTVRNPWNRAVRGVPKKEVQQLFPYAVFEFKQITLAPPLTRVLAGFFPGFCALLESLEFLNTHLLAVIRKKQ